MAFLISFEGVSRFGITRISVFAGASEKGFFWGELNSLKETLKNTYLGDRSNAKITQTYRQIVQLVYDE